MVKQDTLRYNLAIHNANVKAIVRFAADGAPTFKAEIFIWALARLEQFPFVSVREVLAAADQAGAGIIARKASLADVVASGRSALILLKRQVDLPHATELVQIRPVNEKTITIINHDCDSFRMEFAELEEIYLGLVYLHSEPACDALTCKTQASICIEKIGTFAVDVDYGSLQDLCEEIGFIPIPRCEPSLSSIGDGAAATNASYGDALDVRSDVKGIVLAILTQAASSFETSIDNVEGLHIRRLRRGERVPRGFDNGVNLQRVKALHLLFGGADVFLDVTETCSGRIIELGYGDAVLIDSADELCRTRWQSGWSAVSRQSDCYVASCWQRWRP